MSEHPLRIEIYSRPGCHLCDQAKDAILHVAARYPKVRLELVVTNIDLDAALRERYGFDIPVVMLEGKEIFRHRVNELDFERKLTQLWNTSTF
jgi:hypothetical protein